MKYLALLTLACSVAQASTTFTVGSEVCSLTVCHSVPNSGGVTIDYIQYTPKVQSLIVSIDGVVYDTGLYGAPNTSNLVIYASDGTFITVNLNYTINSHYNCHQNGRTQVCQTQESILDGSTITL